MCAPTRVKSPTRAQIAGAASGRVRKWQPTGGPTVASAPIPVHSVADASVRSQLWPSTSGSIVLVLGAVGAGGPVGFLGPWLLAEGTWTHLWASSTIQRYSRNVGGGLKGKG
jgi:hypothetical protein